MKKILGSLFSLAFVFVLFGCGNPVTEELLSYVNEDLVPLAEKETEILEEYASVTGENYTDDETTYYHISDVILPLYTDFIEDIEALKFESTEIRDVHELFIQAHNTQYNGIVQVMSAIENQDYDMMIQANEKLEEGRTGLRDYQYELQDLAKKYDVQLEMEQ
ncbi:hypothetical protein MTP04_07780 [Lysinibacillus sp. PLM2]|nr:hypothetical protein MTP04_07780 [Lysinibacillus sp. PLM2]